MKKEALPHKRVASMQAFAFNVRRKPFDDVRVRRAMALAFNFEALNKSIFYGQYVRSQSFFGNSELQATGLPEGRELELLNSVKADVPAEVFTTPWKSPANEKDTDFRTNMLAATKLLDEAGWKTSGGQRKNAAGEPLKVEILLVQPDFERIVLPFIENLKKLGIAASVRIVDSSQFEQREKTRDFDMIVDSFGQSHSPGNEQRDYWVRLPRSVKAAATRSVSRARPSTSSSMRSCSPRIGPTSSPRRGRWTVCCCGVSTWFRNGTIRMTASASGCLWAAGRVAVAEPRLCQCLVDRSRQTRGGEGRARQVRRARAILAAMAAAVIGLSASAAVGEERHGLSIFGDLKYPPDFKHFDYVNPDAPKGGKVSQVGPGGTLTFDSFNNFILKGDRAQGLELLYDTLMARAFDEPDAVYGLVAKSADVAPDGLSVVFKLRPEAKFSDGTAVTAEDVVFSFDALKTKGHPSYRIVLRDVEKAEALDAHTVKFVFKGELVKPLPIEVAQLPVLPKAYYTTRNFEETSLEKPVGSGPNKIGPFSQGRYVSYERRDDYWAKDLPVNRGKYNFDEVRYDYFPRPDAGAGGALCQHHRFSRGVHVEGLGDGIRQTDGERRPRAEAVAAGRDAVGAQGFFLNTRRALFQISACGRRSIWLSISSGPTAICFSGSTSGPRVSSRTRI